jgi:hypothetical protein
MAGAPVVLDREPGLATDDAGECEWPGRAWENAVPRPIDATAAPPVIHKVSFLTRWSLPSRRAAAPWVG